jgi:hypothetical protein
MSKAFRFLAAILLCLAASPVSAQYLNRVQTITPVEGNFLTGLGPNGAFSTGGVTLAYLPVTRDRCAKALALLFDTAGGLSGDESWLSIVIDDIAINAPSPTDANNITFHAPFWPVGGSSWVYVAATLKAHFGWSDETTATRIAAAQEKALEQPQ